MTIRARLTVWYGAILVGSLALMAWVLHYEWIEQQELLLVHKASPEPVWEEVGEIVLLYGLPTAVLLLVGGWWLMRKAFQPVTALTEAVERIQLNHLKDERLPRLGNGDELDRLTDVFNAMVSRLHDSFARVREFTLHASHELKTPLMIMQAEVETAMRNAALEPSREVFAGLVEEIQRLSKIVDGLTLLTKADSSPASFPLQSVRLDQLVRDSFEDAILLAQPNGISVKLGACDELCIQGNRHRLRQLLLNLSDNAIKYNKPGGVVIFELRRNGRIANLSISNSGPGIPAASIPRVCDPFFRGASAQLNARDGCGLGLSIAQWIVNSHGADLGISSEPGLLTTVSVRFPLEGVCG